MGVLTVRTAGRSDRGLQRANNEDACVVGTRLLVVADGVGGAVAGEVASAIVAKVFAEGDAHAAADDPATSADEVLGRLIAEASTRVREDIDAHPAHTGMSTTVTAAMIGTRTITVAQVGDSRAYQLAAGGGPLTQITRDDSLVQSLVDNGEITAAEAAEHPRRNVIVQAVDGSVVSPSYVSRPLVAGDRYLLCSDGLSDYVDHGVIAEVMRTGQAPDEIADGLIAAAYDVDAPDNVTVIVAEVVAS